MLRTFLFNLTLTLPLLFLGPSVQAESENPVRTIRLETGYPVVNLLEKQIITRPLVGLALSGGGARGFAQIGVLKALHEGGIPIDFIAGSSMGSIIGGLYAVGYTPEELERLTLATDWNQLFIDDRARTNLFVTQKMDQTDHTIQFRLKGLQPHIPNGLSAGQKLQLLFTSLTASANYLADGDFSRLPTPFLAVATELTTGERVVLDSGNLAEAMRASAAVPVIFAPVGRGDGLLVDGGIVEPLPVDLAREMGADVVLAVNTQDTPRTKDQLAAPWDVVDQVITISLIRASEEQRDRADVVITPEIGDHASSSFSDIDQLIQRGYEGTFPMISNIRDIIEQESWLRAEQGGTVERVTIDGCADSDHQRLTLALRTKPGMLMDASMIRGDLETLYREGKYADVAAEVYGDGAERHILYRLVKNPPLTDVTIDGATIGHPDTLLALMRSRSGQPIDYRSLRQDGERILQWYKDRNYTLAHPLAYTVNLETGQAKLEIDEGRIASVQVIGNDRTRDWAILREFPLEAGDIFDAKEADRGITNIYSTGLFESITLDINRQNSRPRVRIGVKERPSLVAKIGGHFDRERQGGYVLSLTEANLFGTGSRVTGRIDHGSRRQRYGLDFRSDRVFKTYLTYRISLYRNEDDRYVYDKLSQIGDFRENRNGVRFTLGQQLARFGSVSLTARVEGVTVSTRAGVSPNVRSDIRSLTLRSQVDNLDRYPFPSSGHLHDASIEVAGAVLGGHQRFLKGHASLEWYRTIVGRVTVRPRFVFGIGEGTLPFSEQFSLGGQHSFFGYRDDQFRGAYLLRGSLMVRTLILSRVYADIRYDTGGLWQKRREFRWDDLRHGFGAGIGLDTPLGPLQVFYGSASFGARRTYVSLGHRF